MDRPPIVSLVTGGLADMARAARTAPVLFALFWIANLVFLSFVAMRLAAAPHPIFVTAGVALSSAITSCVAVTLQRFVILSEVNGMTSLGRLGPIVLRFGSVIFVAHLVALTPAMVARAAFSDREAIIATFVGNAAVIPIVLAFVLRYLFWFPAIAVEAPDRSLAKAADRGSGMIVRTAIACGIATMAIGLASLPFGFPIIEPGEPPSVAKLAIRSLFDIALVAAPAAIVARAWLWPEAKPEPA